MKEMWKNCKISNSSEGHFIRRFSDIRGCTGSKAVDKVTSIPAKLPFTSKYFSHLQNSSNVTSVYSCIFHFFQNNYIIKGFINARTWMVGDKKEQGSAKV